MSQETPIGNLGGGSMNQEDSRLVDSILDDLNNSGQQQQQHGAWYPTEGQAQWYAGQYDQGQGHQ